MKNWFELRSISSALHRSICDHWYSRTVGGTRLRAQLETDATRDHTHVHSDWLVVSANPMSEVILYDKYLITKF